MRVAASRWPPAEVVHQIHDRYLVEIVEALNLCPFARRSREQGRVERPLLWIDERGPSAKDVANTVAETCARNPEVEIILLTFLGWEQHAWARPAAFEDLVRELRELYEREHANQGETRFYMVPFHPRLTTPADRQLTPESLVALIRRSPDPVIQCVRARVLDDVRRQAQRASEARFREEIAKLAPELATLLERSVQTDPELSSDIARHNFTAIGEGDGRTRFEERLASILRDRDAAYARAVDDG
ncbi:MAG: DUF1415 family protein [Myxococcales bacterium]|nr:DUF1415 family protein [Myxococcales bacterium]MCB9752218.1 DUF1415 family protein [Myxococcales bacterium]